MDLTEIDREDFRRLLEEIGRARMPFGKFGPADYPPAGVPVMEGGADEPPPPHAHKAMARIGANRHRSRGNCVAEAVCSKSAMQRRTAIDPNPNHRVGPLG